MTDETSRTPWDQGGPELEEQIRKVIASELRSFTADERRALYINTLAGLAANLLTVVVVAVAVVFTRAQSTKTGSDITFYALLGALVLMPIMGIWSARNRRARGRIFLASSFCFMGLIGLTLLLAWLGKAAGIR